MMCIAWMRSFFGRGKQKPFMLDGPGMERVLWSEFTISRCAVNYEPIYTYTVKHDDIVDETHLYIKVHKGQTADNSIRLESQTVSELFNLNLMSLPDAQILCGTVLGLSITDSNGQVFSKSLSNAMEKEILALITPYVDKQKDE